MENALAYMKAPGASPLFSGHLWTPAPRRPIPQPNWRRRWIVRAAAPARTVPNRIIAHSDSVGTGAGPVAWTVSRNGTSVMIGAQGGVPQKKLSEVKRTMKSVVPAVVGVPASVAPPN